MHHRHTMHYMQQQPNPGSLLTALEVQQLLSIDRSTVYRMAEDGRLPAIRVGRSWRFPAGRIHALLSSQSSSDAQPPDPATAGSSPAGASPGPEGGDRSARHQPQEEPGAATSDRPLLGAAHRQPGDSALPAVDPAAALAAVEVGSDLLGVMMVVTDMHGRPLTTVTNPCPWFAEHGTDPDVLASCIAEWRDLADHPDLTPRFQPGEVGFECARAFIRNGSTLVGMVLAGGVSPSADETTDPDLYHLDAGQRQRVLGALPRIAAAISTTTPRPAADTPTTPDSGVASKEK